MTDDLTFTKACAAYGYTPEAAQSLILELERCACEREATCPACHDWRHTCRVRKTALELCYSEGGNCFIVELAAILHDIARKEEMESKGQLDHAVLGAELAAEMMRTANVTNEQLIDAVSRCVRTHRFRERTGQHPETLEQRIVYDADKLDSLGAIGIGRAFHFAGRCGAAVHNTEEEALSSAPYSSGDSAYREYLVKLRHIPEKMMTVSGRKIADERLSFMQAFFSELNQETMPNL